MTFSIVVPVYRNEESIAELLRSLEGLDRDMRGELEAVFVVDGSPDRSLELLLRELPAAPFRSRLVTLSRNFGSFAAILAGLELGLGPHFAIMAADLQEPPELYLAFRAALLTGDAEVLIGRRIGRQDPLSMRVASRLFWGLYRLMVRKDLPPGGVDVFACNRKARDQLVALRELNSTLIGLLYWIGFRRAEIPYRRRRRAHGTSAWSLARRVRYFLDSVFGFSDLPVRLLGLAGILGMTLAVILGVVVVWARLTGRTEVPGYTATALIVIFFGGLNAFGLGLIGEYLWRAFENTKARPPFIVAGSWDFPGARIDDDPRTS